MGERSGVYRDVWGTLDDEAVGEAVQPDGAALLVQVHLLLGEKVGNPAARTQPEGTVHASTDRQTLWV